MIDNANITVKAREVAHCLTYNDDTHQAQAKFLLIELSHRLDSLNVRARKKKDGLLLINAIGKSRYATIKERILYKLFNVLPSKV